MTLLLQVSTLEPIFMAICALLHNSERSLLDDDFSNSQEWTKYELLSFGWRFQI